MAGGYFTAITQVDIGSANYNEFVRDQLFSQFTDATARDAAITSPVAGMHAYLRTPKVDTFYDGTAWRGEWVTSFASQLDQGATTNIAHTVTLSQYRYDGPMIDWQFLITITGAGTGNAAITLTLPVAILVSGQPVGTGSWLDSSVARQPGLWEASSTTQIGMRDPTVAAAAGIFLGQTGSSNNAAVANTDTLSGSIRYRWV